MNFVIERGPNKLRQVENELQEPGPYEVYLHNDDFTPMEFVVRALELFFQMDLIKAKKIMLEAHTKGRAVCGIYSKEIAETRIDQAIEYARMHDHPLRWSMEMA